MNRRSFLSWTANTLGALGLGANKLAAQTHTASPAASVQGKRPNILLLVSDQHKRACMGVAGDSVAHTPNLDRLARQSVRFTNAYCTNPVCAPSRASFLTGRYSHNLESSNNGESYSPRHKTMAHAFGRAGYFPALIGKMHFVDGQTHGFEYELEFNEWLQYLGPKAKLAAEERGHPDSGAGLPQISSLWKDAGNPWNGVIERDDRLGPVAVGRPSRMEEADHFESFVARESIRFLESYARADAPFFLVSSFLKPHEPFMPAGRFAAMYEPEQMKLSPTWGKADLDTLPQEVRRSIQTCHYTPELVHADEARKRMAYYYGNLAQTDDAVGQVLDALVRLGLEENTIVLYTADHGEMLGDLGLWDKFQFYEGSCGVPLLVRMPGGAPAVCDQPVSLISLLPTLAELCQLELPGPCDGPSIAPLIRQPNAAINYGPVFAEFALGSKNAKYMIRDGNLKYTYWAHDIAELYDLRTDPAELQNLAALPQHQQTVQRLQAQLFAWHRPTEAETGALAGARKHAHVNR